MSQKSRNRDRIHAALGAAFAAVLVMAGNLGTARAGDDDGAAAGGNWIRGIYDKLNQRASRPVGTGDYRERPPLVVPPTRELPPPGTSTTLAARNPAWPVDRGAARAERRPADGQGDGQPSQSSSVEAVGQGKTTTYVEPSLPKRLWSKFVGSKEPELAVFTREPPRTTLADPPRGYRTPSPNEPYGVNNMDTADTLRKASPLTGKPENENR